MLAYIICEHPVSYLTKQAESQFERGNWFWGILLVAIALIVVVGYFYNTFNSGSSGSGSKTSSYSSSRPKTSGSSGAPAAAKPSVGGTPNQRSQDTVFDKPGSDPEVSTPKNPDGCLEYGSRLRGGRYLIKEYIARGGFGITYKAFDTQARKEVAIKELFKRDICERTKGLGYVTVSIDVNKPQFEDHKSKFNKEARRLMAFNHPNIIKVSEVFDEKNTTYYVMDYINGKSLKQEIERKGRLTEEEVKKLLPPVISALKNLHRENVLHMDLKPANIMLKGGSCPVLIDLGASKQYYDAEGNTLHTSTAVAFTRGFAPPEQQEQQKKNIGAWTDVYALGGVIYNALVGTVPPSHSEILNDGLDLPPHISARMARAITGMLKPARRERPQTMEEAERLLGLAM